MENNKKQIANHMRDFGCYALGRAVYECIYSELMRPYVHVMAVTTAAHAAELIIKAKIVEEHPLLIFDILPKSTSTTGALEIADLIERGRTIQYSDLPDRLWASTGYRIKSLEQYQSFGKLRNAIMHFTIPEANHAHETLRFAFEVVDPLLQDLWDESLIPYAEEWDEAIVTDGYLQEQMEGIKLTRNSRKAIKRAR